MEEEERITENRSATEEKSSVAFSDWTQKLRFDRSFTAKLLLADKKVKTYYADIATEFLKYEKIRAKTSWSGVAFTAGKNRVAYVTIVGKSLRLYLALDPETLADGKYKARNASEIKSRAKTPAMLVIKSDGAERHALKLINETAGKAGLTKKEVLSAPVKAENFRHESFDNLVSRGLIRMIRTTVKPREIITETDEEDEPKPVIVVEETSEKREGAGDYSQTVKKVNELLSVHGEYAGVLNSLTEGNARIRLSEKYMLRSVDEIWVKAVEDCLNSLDELIRNPKHFIAETEEILPIELTKKITGRSITFLGRHTDFIRKGEDGEISPTKMLNVFREDSILTYENKFLNTLLNRLYLFVNKRYNVAKEHGIDEKLQSFEFENAFDDGNGKGRIKVSVEYSERNFGDGVKNNFYDTGLWKRVERLNDIVTAYANSSFVRAMDKNFVRPPIMRTNAILKNKYFRECLALWEFIESYEDAGYGVTINETVKTADEQCVKETYEWAAAQYLAFRKAIDENYGESEEYNGDFKPVYAPETDLSADGLDETFNGEGLDISFDDDLTLALKVALAADEEISEEEESLEDIFAEDETAITEESDGSDDAEESGETEYENRERVTRTFQAKIRLASGQVKENYAAIVNAFNAYDKVRLNESRRFASFFSGRKLLARVTVSEKSLRLYLALDPAAVDEKFRAADASEVKTYADTPAKIRVRGGRSLKHALELIGSVAEKFELKPAKKQKEQVTAENYAPVALEEMIENGWVKTTIRRVAAGTPAFGGNLAKDPSFGPKKSEKTQVAAATVEKLAVSEPDQSLENIEAEEKEAEAKINPDALAAAKHIESVIRPENDYSVPTEYGVDDSSDFILDEKKTEIPPAEPEKKRKFGFGKRRKR